MIKHLLKLIWNRKKNNFLLLIEIFLSFLVLFGLLSFSIYQYSKLTSETGFEYKDILTANINWKKENDESVKEKLKQIKSSLKNFPEVEEVSLAAIFTQPYSTAQWTIGIKNKKGFTSFVNVHPSDDNLAKSISLNLIEGRWFNESDNAESDEVVVINNKFKKEYFGDENAAGKIMINHESNSNKKYKVIGVVDHFKYGGEFSEENGAMLQRFTLENKFRFLSDYSVLIIKLKPGSDLSFEEKIVNHITTLTNGWEVNAELIEEKREAQIKSNLMQVLIPSSLGFFLILNVAFGLMGVLWYSINRRKSEIGLRIALGATGKKISKQIIIEALILGSFAIVIGIVFAIQVPILKVFNAEFIIYLISIATASIFLYCLVTVCSFYPGLLASKIQPVDALHNE